ncbi:hypothetical protein HMPREF9103_00037 [Lentilactobacillus parafarraginis F0439]|uniref:Uncharacterized protein n=1 Tax=Lentilactobacillus parafarraginis F0439 TaxID=797515 RepID=G9ZJZ1_9LACO|nr:hypothetical protein HMPREF9103_00037 [Lentilactobacillus parafarraginis F0439]
MLGGRFIPNVEPVYLSNRFVVGVQTGLSSKILHSGTLKNNLNFVTLIVIEGCQFMSGK